MKRKIQIAAFGVLVLWVVIAGFLVPGVIRDAYEGKSWAMFNELIRGQDHYPVEYYGRIWDAYFWFGAAVLGAAFLMALVPVGLKCQLSIISKVMISVIIFFGICEIGLRVKYWNGETFGTHAGPIQGRFERDIVFNGLDGSRGPAVTGPKGEGEVRVLVQGDSITWGHGVRDEGEVYPAKLLELFRQGNPRMEMAVLARPGREMDGHLEQIKKYGAAIQPDLILYQWYVNDLELGAIKARKMDASNTWRKSRLFRHLRMQSYFMFLLDYQMNALKADRMAAYESYMLENFEGDTPEWHEFVDTFEAWVEEGRKLSPRIGVVLYPHFSGTEGLGVLGDKVAELGLEMGLEVLELEPLLADLRGNPEKRMASRFDNHPSALVHERLADEIHAWAVARWPEITVCEGALEAP